MRSYFQSVAVVFLVLMQSCNGIPQVVTSGTDSKGVQQVSDDSMIPGNAGESHNKKPQKIDADTTTPAAEEGHNVKNHDSPRNDDAVKLQFYGEPGCPYCQDVLMGPLAETLAAEGVADIIDLELSEFGNSFFATPKCSGSSNIYSSEVRHCIFHECHPGKSGSELSPNCFNGPLVCQHGPKECKLVKYAACVNQIETPHKYAEYLQCTAEAYQFKDMALAEKLAPYCAKKTGVKLDEMEKCYSSTQGDEAILTEAKAMPEHPGVPYVLLDGHPLSDEDQEHLLAKVCEAYKGPTLPKGCVPPGTTGRVTSDDDFINDKANQVLQKKKKKKGGPRSFLGNAEQLEKHRSLCV